MSGLNTVCELNLLFLHAIRLAPQRAGLQGTNSFRLRRKPIQEFWPCNDLVPETSCPAGQNWWRFFGTFETPAVLAALTQRLMTLDEAEFAFGRPGQRELEFDTRILLDLLFD